MERTGAFVVVYIGLGANLGDRQAALRSAVASLSHQGIQPLRLSPLYESDYVGPGSPQPPYLNAVVEARTALLPLELLERTRDIERAHGRQPHTHLRPRPLDLDVLLYGGWSIRHPALVVPHPRLGERLFVLLPLRDLGVLERRPEWARRLATLAGAVAPRPWVGGDWGACREASLC